MKPQFIAGKQKRGYILFHGEYFFNDAAIRGMNDRRLVHVFPFLSILATSIAKHAKNVKRARLFCGYLLIVPDLNISEEFAIMNS
jgi:hypothetical protein